jgi:glycosyltransferase involved in cell wall biosynthesis
MELERVRFHGRQEPVPFYRKARYLLMTSDFEGYPMVLVEAQASGCVPIAFESFASIGDIITDGESGCLVRPGDIEHFTETLRRAMHNPEQTAAMALNALEQSEKYSPARIADQWESVFSRAT